jgi:excisionase family DNA binding protein
MLTYTHPERPEDYCGTTYAAKLLGLSVGTIQALVEKTELQAWKTQGGHRRIAMQSIRDYQRRHNMMSNLPESRQSRLKVLLVEDDEVTREMMRDFCTRCDMPVDCTAMGSGLEALIDISSILPDVLIADLNMPGVDGFELLRTLRQNPVFSRMTCLVISALTDKEVKSRGSLPEGTIFVAKPVNLQWLNGFFTALMAGRHADHANKERVVQTA